MNLFWRRIGLGLLLAAVASAADIPASVSQALEHLEQQLDKTPAELAIEFRVEAAQTVQVVSPDLAREWAARSVAQLKSGVKWKISPNIMGALAKLDPAGAIAVLPRMQADYAGPVIDELGHLHRIDDARLVYRNALARGASVMDAFSLLIQLSNEKSPKIADVYRDMLAGFRFKALEPEDAYWIDSELTQSVERLAPQAALDGTLQILQAASDPSYDTKILGRVSATFQIGSKLISTTDSRDTVLLLAGARLLRIAPPEFEKRKALFTQWGGAVPIIVKSVQIDVTSPRAKSTFSTKKIAGQVAATRANVMELEGQPGLDSDLVIRLAEELRRQSPGWAKLDAALQLARIVLDRQASKPALDATTLTLIAAVQECHPVLEPFQVPVSFYEDYLRVAELIRYAKARFEAADPAIATANDLLILQERVLERVGFEVATFDGKPRTITPVLGKATLVSLLTNSCPRWSGQCDQPLPILNDVGRELATQGVAVFAIGEEDRNSFVESLKGESFSFPIFIDPDGRSAAIFAKRGRHETFLFNKAGNLVSLKIGIQTKAQLLETAKDAGLN